MEQRIRELDTVIVKLVSEPSPGYPTKFSQIPKEETVPKDEYAS